MRDSLDFRDFCEIEGLLKIILQVHKKFHLIMYGFELFALP